MLMLQFVGIGVGSRALIGRTKTIDGQHICILYSKTFLWGGIGKEWFFYRQAWKCSTGLLFFHSLFSFVPKGQNPILHTSFFVVQS